MNLHIDETNSEFLDRLDRHIAQAPNIGAAAVPMGMYLAWAANLQLLTGKLRDEHSQLCLQIQVGEVPGSHLLVACGGDLRMDMFVPEGLGFSRAYYAKYYADFARLFGQSPYEVADNAQNYRKIAQHLTDEYMRFIGRDRVSRTDAQANGARLAGEHRVSSFKSAWIRSAQKVRKLWR